MNVDKYVDDKHSTVCKLLIEQFDTAEINHQTIFKCNNIQIVKTDNK